MKNHGTHSINGALSFFLAGMFAVLALLVVLIGAKGYRGVVAAGARNYEARASASYLVHKIRASDTEGGIQLREQNGETALVLRQKMNGDWYETVIYCNDGMLREHFGPAGTAFSPESGEPIAAATRLTVSITDPQVLEIGIAGTDGTERRFSIALRAADGKEAS